MTVLAFLESFRDIDTVNILDESRWMLAIQSRLQIGQPIEYFDAQANSRAARASP